jgi:hypothetical protein
MVGMVGFVGMVGWVGIVVGCVGMVVGAGMVLVGFVGMVVGVVGVVRNSWPRAAPPGNLAVLKLVWNMAGLALIAAIVDAGTFIAVPATAVMLGARPRGAANRVAASAPLAPTAPLLTVNAVGELTPVQLTA